MSKVRTIFMGTPEFSVSTLKALINSDFIEVIAVICNQDKLIGRKQILTPPPTKILAQKYNIPVLQPDKIRKPEWIEKIKELNPELIIVAAFGQIIPKEILDIPKYKSINIHGSLLPKLRGASPVQYAILEGYKTTGVTIMIMDELMDHGPILTQQEIEINEKETSETLFKKMSKIGADLLMATLPNWIAGKITPKEQNHNELTLTKILKKEDGKIIWANGADEIERQIRAFNPWPGTFCFFSDQSGNQKRLKIIEADIVEVEPQNPNEVQPPRIEPGLLFISNTNLLVQAGKDCLKLTKIQLEGKKSLTTEEFLNGYKYLLNTKLF